MKKGGKERVEAANEGLDYFQSRCTDEETKNLAAEVISNIKRLEVKGKKNKTAAISEVDYENYPYIADK